LSYFRDALFWGCCLFVFSLIPRLSRGVIHPWSLSFKSESLYRFFLGNQRNTPPPLGKFPLIFGFRKEEAYESGDLVSLASLVVVPFVVPNPSERVLEYELIPIRFQVVLRFFS